MGGPLVGPGFREAEKGEGGEERGGPRERDPARGGCGNVQLTG